MTGSGQWFAWGLGGILVLFMSHFAFSLWKQGEEIRKLRRATRLISYATYEDDYYPPVIEELLADEDRR